MAKPPALPSLKALDSRAPKAAPMAERKAPAQRAENPHYRPSREGMENLTGYFPKPVKHQLMELTIERRKALDHKVTIQDLMAEALNDLFAKYGKPEIAPISGKS